MVGNNISILLTVLIGVGLSILTISSIPFLGLTESFSQTTETKSSSLHITKHSSNSYALSSGSSHIGSFDTTYNILGSVSSIKDSKDLITSTIINDYDKSPFIGYVIVQKGKSSDSSKSPGLANPFADKTTINEKIKSEIQKSIDSTNKINTKEAVIKCDFGMEISKWNCITHGLIG
ncbi:MAG TPA: hypothetical protein VFM28_00410 [Nitrososphaeraceae archaeon]|jgi:hypothetical protein|nr:hypothetical protein [Nitrososphaeraceae archaeon]